MHQIAPFFKKKIPGGGGGGGGGGGMPPDPLAWLLAFCARRKILHVSNMMKKICILWHQDKLQKRPMEI